LNLETSDEKSLLLNSVKDKKTKNESLMKKNNDSTIIDFDAHNKEVI